MSAPLFLVEQVPDGEQYTLTGPEGHHAADVQRLRIGEALLLGDGRGAQAHAEVCAVGKGCLTVRVGQRCFTDAPSPAFVVVQALAKGDRGELATQLLTEVGADVIIPWAAQRCVVQWSGDRGVKARQRWVDVAREAAKQSRRAWLPEVTATASTAEVARRLAGAVGRFVLHEEATDRLTQLPGMSRPATARPAGEIVLVIGPEGGISPEELTAFAAVAGQPVRLGRGVMRTSTAGAAAVSALSALLGRW